jgi:hypothetical protein
MARAVKLHLGAFETRAETTRIPQFRRELTRLTAPGSPGAVRLEPAVVLEPSGNDPGGLHGRVDHRAQLLEGVWLFPPVEHPVAIRTDDGEVGLRVELRGPSVEVGKSGEMVSLDVVLRDGAVDRRELLPARLYLALCPVDSLCRPSEASSPLGSPVPPVALRLNASSGRVARIIALRLVGLDLIPSLDERLVEEQ